MASKLPRKIGDSGLCVVRREQKKKNGGHNGDDTDQMPALLYYEYQTLSFSRTIYEYQTLSFSRTTTKYKELPIDALSRLQQMYSKTRVLIQDEISMFGQVMLGNAARRCDEIFNAGVAADCAGADDTAPRFGDLEQVWAFGDYYEYQSRRSAHLHCLFWHDNAPPDTSLDTVGEIALRTTRSFHDGAG